MHGSMHASCIMLEKFIYLYVKSADQEYLSIVVFTPNQITCGTQCKINRINSEFKFKFSSFIASCMRSSKTCMVTHSLTLIYLKSVQLWTLQTALDILVECQECKESRVSRVECVNCRECQE